MDRWRECSSVWAASPHLSSLLSLSALRTRRASRPLQVETEGRMDEAAQRPTTDGERRTAVPVTKIPSSSGHLGRSRLPTHHLLPHLLPQRLKG